MYVSFDFEEITFFKIKEYHHIALWQNYYFVAKFEKCCNLICSFIFLKVSHAFKQVISKWRFNDLSMCFNISLFIVEGKTVSQNKIKYLQNI